MSRLLHYLVAQYESGTQLVNVAEVKKSCELSDQEFWKITNHFIPTKIYNVDGSGRLQIKKIVLDYKSRLAHCSLMDALTFFRGIRSAEENQQLTQIITASAKAKAEIPAITLQSILEFSGNVDDGKLIKVVAPPWFEIMKMIRSDPDSIYSIDPYAWEEIIAGAYTRAGFDEVILTPRSGDNGRDVIATKNGIGSIRIFDQVKAYKPGHVVTAEAVRAMVGTITAAGNVSKGVVTTTSRFAPRILEVDFVKHLVPYRLELKDRDDLLTWLKQVSSPT